MLSLGASGYLIKDEVPKNIVDAIRGVARGEQGWVSREVAAILSQLAVNTNPSEDLTERELEVLSHVVNGETNREIAYALEISEKTDTMKTSWSGARPATLKTSTTKTDGREVFPCISII